MANLASIRCGFYRIPLPVVLSDSTHGEMRAFELNTSGSPTPKAPKAWATRTPQDEMAPLSTRSWSAKSLNCSAARRRMRSSELAQGVVGAALWRPGGPTVLAISAFDMALWDLKAKRARLPLWNLLGGFDARVPCYAGGIDLDLALDKLLRQTDDNLAKGFRAIKMKVGRKRLAEDIERVKAMRAHLGEGFPTDGRCEHEMVGR